MPQLQPSTPSEGRQLKSRSTVTKTGNEKTPSVSFISPKVVLKDHDNDVTDKTLRRTARYNMEDTFSLDSIGSESVFLLQKNHSSSQSSKRKASVPPDDIPVDSASKRLLHSVQMKVELAEAIVRNAETKDRTSLTLEVNRPNMVQLEVAKLILFVGRQFNVFEELQQGLGRALDVADNPAYRRNAFCSDLPFLSPEVPPNLSLTELKKTTAEMEKQLENEKGKMGDAWNTSSLRVDAVTSNLSELLWIIESLDLEMPSAHDVDIDDRPHTSYLEGAKSKKSVLTQQAGHNEWPLSLKKTLEVSSDKGRIKLPFLLGDFSAHDAVERKTSLSSGETLQDELEEENEEEKLIGFSIDDESVDCFVPEAAKLKLLQFMYDAIVSDSERQNNEENMNDSMYDSALDPLNNTKWSTHDRIMRSTVRGLLETTTTTVREEKKQLISSNNGLLDFALSLHRDSREGSFSHSTGTTTSSPQSQLTGSPATDVESASVSVRGKTFASWMHHLPSTGRLHPIRERLIDILRELYNTFGYNYHFQQIRSKNAGKMGKSDEDYTAEMEMLLERQRLEKSHVASLKQQEQDELFFPAENNTRKSTACDKLGGASNLSLESSSEDNDDKMGVVEETSPLAPAPIAKEASPGPVVPHDETLVFMVELGDGLMFVVKGKKTDQSNSAVTAATLKSKGNAKKKKKQAAGISRSGEKGDEEDAANAEGNTHGGASGETSVTMGGEEGSKKGKRRKTLVKAAFDEYILYAINQSDESRSAVVGIDTSKLQNMRIRELSEYAMRNNAIAINLPPNGSSAVLYLKPVKKRCQVTFDGAFTFQDVANTIEEGTKKRRKSKAEKRRTLRLSAERLVQHRGSATPLSLTAFMDPGTGLVFTSSRATNGDTENDGQDSDTRVRKTGQLHKRVEGSSRLHGASESKKDVKSRGNFFVRMQPLRLLPPGRFSDHMEDIDKLDEMPSLDDEGEAEAEKWGIGALRTSDEKAKGWKKGMGSVQYGGVERIPSSDKGWKINQDGTLGLGPTGIEEASREKSDDVAGVMRVDQWGVTLRGEDADAFEKNCVALSVLQASGWREAQREAGDSTAMSAAGVGTRIEEEAIIDAILDDPLSSASPEYSSARFCSHGSAERMVASVLQHMADEEHLGALGDFHGFGTPFQSEGGLNSALHAGSVASWRHQVSSQMQQLRDDTDMASLYQVVPAGDQSPSSTFYADAAGIRSHYSCEGGEMMFRTAHAVENDQVYPFVKGGTSFGSNVFCESCAERTHFDGDWCEQRHEGAVKNDTASTPTQSQFAPQVSQKTSEARGEYFDGIAGAPAVGDKPHTFLESMLVDVVSVDRTTKQPFPPLHFSTENEIPEFPSFQTTGSLSSPLQGVFVESRPNGRLAFFVPETMDFVDTSHGTDASTAMKGSSGMQGSAVKVAERIRTNFHKCARQNALHGNQLSGAHQTATSAIAGSTRSGKVTAKKVPDTNRGSSFPPLPLLYAPEAMPDVDNIEAAEEEALDLFMRDPARYDCVVDDIVQRAIQRVDEEEIEVEMRKEQMTALGESKKWIKESQASSGKLQPGKTHTALATTKYTLHGGGIDSIEGERNSVSQRSLQRGAGGSIGSQSPNLDNLNGSQTNITKELQRLADEQRRAKKIVAYILMEMRRMWRRREVEASIAFRAAVDRFINRSVLFAWRLERRRVLNLQKLIHLLDRKTGRVSGWLPFYSKEGVVEDLFVWEPAPSYLSRPLQVVHRAMCLARQQRLSSLRTVRQQARKKLFSRHLLYGYERRMLEPFPTTALRLRYERRARCVAPFHKYLKTFSSPIKGVAAAPIR